MTAKAPSSNSAISAASPGVSTVESSSSPAGAPGGALQDAVNAAGSVRTSVAWFSPLPPKKTGIASYSAELLRALDATGRVALELFDSQPEQAELAGYRVRDIAELQVDPDLALQLGVPVYQLGNNAAFHADIFRQLRRQPGVVILHDAILYYLMAGMGAGRLWRALAREQGREAIASVRQIDTEAPAGIAHFPHPEQYPLLTELFDHCLLMVVHNRAAAELVRQQGYRGPLEVMPHLATPAPPFDAEQIRQLQLRALAAEKKANPDLKVIGLFGFRGDAKRADSLSAALRLLPEELTDNLRLLVVGAGHRADWLQNHPLAERIIHTDYVDDRAFWQGLQLSDLVINLRYPSYGETSGVQIRAMSAGCATIVTDTGWFAELPDDCCRKIPWDARELPELTAAIHELLCENHTRQQLGINAQQLMLAKNSPAVVAEQLLEIIERARRLSRRGVAIGINDSQPGDWVTEYMTERFARLSGVDLRSPQAAENPENLPPEGFKPWLKVRLKPAVNWLRGQRWALALYRTLRAMPLIGKLISRLAGALLR